MSSFSQVFEILIGHEGGYVNDPRDPGGETKFGISKRSYPKEDIRALTLERAKILYKRDYWDRIRGDQLPPSVALVTFDAAVNSGVGQASLWLQAAVGTKQDGDIGAITLAAVNKAVLTDLVRDLLERRLFFMEQLATYSTFGRGWRRRIITLTMQATTLQLSAKLT